MVSTLAAYTPFPSRLLAPSLSKKLFLIFVVILVVAFANVMVVRSMLHKLNGVAETINVAGKQRMLTQKIAFEAAKALNGEQESIAVIKDRMTDFDAALSGLGHGGNVFGYDVKSLPRELLTQQETERKDWERFKSNILTVLTHPAPTAKHSQDLTQITRDADALLNDAEGIVHALTREAKKTQQAAMGALYALLLVDICVLFAVFIAVRLHIVRPLRALARKSMDIAAGNYDSYFISHSNDEIGQLANALDYSARNIRDLINQVELDRVSIKQAESMFRGLTENTVVGVYITQDTKFRFVNPKMATMFGYERDEMMKSVNVLDIVADADIDLVKQNIERRLNGETNEVNYERRARHKDGSIFHVEVFGSTMVLAGQPATIGIMLDISERRRIDRALRVLSACNQALVRATDEGALLEEICRIVQSVNGFPFVWVGYPQGDANERVHPVAIMEKERGALANAIGQPRPNGETVGSFAAGAAIRTGQTVVLKKLNPQKCEAPWGAFLDKYKILSVMSQPLKVGSKVLGALTVYSQEADTFTPEEVRIADELAANLSYGISALRTDAAREHYARQLEYNANHDSLTGLANRNLLSERLKQAMAAAQRNGHMVAVLLHDLDNFKVINDSLGHAAGDKLLQAVALRLASSVGDTDTVARFGGDEFVIVAPNLTDRDEADRLARKLLNALTTPFMVANQEMLISTSIGISLYPHDGEREELLLQNVDLAMYRAKNEGRNHFCFYQEEMNASNRERQTMEIDLHHALRRNELRLHYQPKIDAQSGAIVGVEALLRWQHSEYGMIPPGKFIPLSEETGQIVPIGTWVLDTACHQIKAWQEAGLSNVSVAVNLSARQFQNHDLVGQIQRILIDSSLPPACLELELTETVIMRDIEGTIKTLRELKGLGVRISLDDFGTGYSSLNYIRRFPLDNLKIDQAFIRGITTNLHDETIVKSVIDLAHSLNLKVIAEGVETHEQLTFLRNCQCDELQGYYFSRPLPPEEVAKMMRDGVSLGLQVDTVNV